LDFVEAFDEVASPAPQADNGDTNAIIGGSRSCARGYGGERGSKEGTASGIHE